MNENEPVRTYFICPNGHVDMDRGVNLPAPASLRCYDKTCRNEKLDMLATDREHYEAGRQ